MPTINLNKKPTKEKVERNQTENRKLRAKAYNNTNWKKLRLTYLKEHAVCQDCIAKGKITPSTDVHHIRSPFQNGEINYSLLLDYTNLMSLCKECHGERHASEQGHKTITSIIEELDKLFEDVN